MMRDALLEMPDGDFPEAPRDMFGPRRQGTITAARLLPLPAKVTPTPVPPTAKDPPITLASLKRKSSRVIITVLTRK